MAYFPFFMELSNQKGLIIGGGTVALRKAEKLLPYGPKLTVVAPSICAELKARSDLTLEERSFSPTDLDGAFFVIAATDSPALNHEVAQLCQTKNILVNVVDDKAACSFLFPALVQRGPLSVGISTSGASPTAAVWLKEQIGTLLPERLDEILLWLEEQRPSLKESTSDEALRARLFARLFSACMEMGTPLSETQKQLIVQQEACK